MIVQGAKENYDRASELYNEKRYAEALELLNELNRVAPNHPKILHSRALVLAALGRLQDAETIAAHLDTVLSYSHASELKLYLQDEALNSVDHRSNSFRSDLSFSLRQITLLGAFGLACAGIAVFGTLVILDVSNERTPQVAQTPIAPSLIRELFSELIESDRNSVEEQIALGDLEDAPPEAANSTFQPGKSASAEKPADGLSSDGNIVPDSSVFLATTETLETPIAERFDSGVEETDVTHDSVDHSPLPREAPPEFEKIFEFKGEFKAEIAEDTLQPAPIEKVEERSEEISGSSELRVAMFRGNERHSGEYKGPATLFVNYLKLDLPDDSSGASIEEEAPETTVASEDIEPGPEPEPSHDNTRAVEAVAGEDAPSLRGAAPVETVSTPPVKEQEPKTIVVAKAPTDSGQDTSQRRGSIEHTVRENELLTEIASLYGVSAADLVRWNDLQQAKLEAGSTLTIYLEPERPIGEELDFKVPSEDQKGASMPDLSNLTYKMVHTVAPGDTLLELAKRYKVSLDDLTLWNGLEDGAIQEGQKLTIFVGSGREPADSTPELKTVQYEVQPGDTLSNIARKFTTTRDLLLQINKIKDPNHIFVGQKLRVPAGA